MTPISSIQGSDNIRLSGFANRASVSAAWAWLDSQSAVPEADVVPLSEALGRVLAETVVINDEPPDRPRSTENGYAVRADECDGAGAYNPLALSLVEPGIDRLAFGSASAVATGWPLPLGADAVLPFEAAQPTGGQSLEILAPVARGAGIERWRHGLRQEMTVMERAKRLRPQDVGLLAAVGIKSVPVSRRPRVAVVVAGAKSGPDALTPLLQALLARDEALIEPIPVDRADELALATALANPKIGNCDAGIVGWA